MKNIQVTIAKGFRTISRGGLFSVAISKDNWDIVKGIPVGSSGRISTAVDNRTWLVSNRGSELSFRCGILRLIVLSAWLTPPCEVTRGDTDTHWACGCPDCVFLQATEAM